MRRAEILTRAPILSNRKRSVVGQALESGVLARAFSEICEQQNGTRSDGAAGKISLDVLRLAP